MTQTVQTPEWIKDAILYQIFPDRFARSSRVTKPSNLEAWDSPPTPGGFKGGDLLGVVERLDYLQDLGITGLYLNPVFQSASNHRYHTHDYYQVDPLLGGNKALRELVDAAHARDIRIILDGVFNHASRGFFQFNHILECGPHSPYLDWFTVKGFPLNAYSNNDEPLNYVAWWDLPALPKFNTDNPHVREFIWDVAVHWIDFGIDGWRLDVAAEIDDDAFWQEFRRRVKDAHPEAYIVGEIWHESQRWLQGDQFDAVMNYIQTRAATAFFGAHSLAPLYPGGDFDRLKPLDGAQFAEAIESMFALYDWEITQAQMNLLGSHDTARFLAMVEEDKTALRLAMLFQMTMPGAPTIYYGDEIGLTGGYEPASRAAMPWDESRWDHDLLAYVKGTTGLRAAHPALRRGTYRTLLATGQHIAYERRHDAERLVVAFNNAQTDASLAIPVEGVTQPPRLVFGDAHHISYSDGILAVEAPKRTGLVFALD